MAATPQIPDTSQISDTPQEETDNVNNLAENEANEVSETSSESNVVANSFFIIVLINCCRFLV